MAWGYVAGATISAVAGASAASKQRKAARQANAAAEEATVDPREVARFAREQAVENIRNSLALEQQYAPENAALRQGSIRALLERAGNDPTGDVAIQAITEQLGNQPAAPDLGNAASFGGTNVNSPLLSEAIAMARGDLAQGGQLPQDVRNEVARRAIATSGRVGGGSLGLSRFLAPRDLGLSSFAVRNQRQDRAAQLGQQEVGVNQANFQNRFNTTQQGFANQQQGFQNQQSSQQLRSQLATLLSNLGTTQTNRFLSLANFGQTLQPPEAGLSPGDIASLYTQNATNRAQAGLNAAQLTAQTGRNTGELYAGVGGLVSGVDWNSIFNRGGATPPYAGYNGSMTNATTG